MDFKERLQRAAERGQQTRDEEARRAASQAMSEQEWRRLHSDYRHTLTEHIEKCLQQLAENFPGFRFQAVVDEKGWGAAVNRDDLSRYLGYQDDVADAAEDFAVTLSLRETKVHDDLKDDLRALSEQVIKVSEKMLTMANHKIRSGRSHDGSSSGRMVHVMMRLNNVRHWSISGDTLDNVGQSLSKDFVSSRLHYNHSSF